MIREIKESDLKRDYFELLSQLSGDVKPHNVYNMWEAYLSGSSKTFVFVEGDDVIGTATIFIEDKFLHCGSRVGHVEDVVVDNSRRIKGVGRSLIEACIGHAEDKECYKVILDCAENVIPFYVKCGFIPAGYTMRYSLDR